ncbi:lysine-rich arabinogalactan protein 19-like [Iris pallida]|uniref:Lysine-rich arabinogalactan protein 19-like n=1 Tax=Iris pallida TaxID=29817 RepID=A0AAX6FR80_IRIPA|nr:lysine-rich arabinogalactan protein 19-like [Iris pallida]
MALRPIDLFQVFSFLFLLTVPAPSTGLNCISGGNDDSPHSFQKDPDSPNPPTYSRSSPPTNIYRLSPTNLHCSLPTANRLWPPIKKTDPPL